MRVTRQTHFWNPQNQNRQDGWLELDQDFYQTIMNSPVPVDTRALKALNHSPLALDLYAWSTHKAYSTSLKNKSLYISYRDLQQQLGAQYSELKAFGRKLRAALKLVRTVYPGLEVQIETGGDPGQVFFHLGTTIFPDGVFLARLKAKHGFWCLKEAENRAVGKWETCFWFSTFPSASSSGLCGIWESRSDFQGLWKAGYAFH